MIIRKRVPSEAIRVDYRTWLEQMAADNKGGVDADCLRQIHLLDEFGLVEDPSYALYLESKEE